MINSKETIKLPPLVSIVILNWNGFEMTKECVNSLLKIEYPNFNILVVDNGSIDDSYNKLKYHFKNIEVIFLNKNYGYTGGNNKGMKYALEKYKPEYILLLNNDTVVEKMFLLEMVKLAESEKKCVAVVPKIFYFNPSNVLYFAGGEVNYISGIATHRGKYKNDSKKYSKIRKVTLANGCCLLLKTNVLKNEIFFDDRFFANMEDVELSIRIIKCNWEIFYQPKAIIWHKESYTTKKANINHFRLYLATRNIILMQRKHTSKILFAIFLLIFCIRWVLLMVFKELFKPSSKNSIYFIILGFLHGFTEKNVVLSNE